MPSPSTVRCPRAFAAFRSPVSKRHVDNVVDDRLRLQRSQIDLERRLPDHAEARRVDEQVGIAHQRWQLVEPLAGHAFSEMRGKRFRLRHGPVAQGHLEPATAKPVDGRTRGATRSEDHRAPGSALPSGRQLVEIADEADGIGVAADQRILLPPQRVDGADCLRRIVDAVDVGA